MRHSRSSLILSLLLAAVCAGCGRGTDDDRATERAEVTTTPAEAVTPNAPQGPIQEVIRTPQGDFTIELRHEAAPVSCANFVNLVNRDFFDGLPFYRHSTVIRQVGNPHGDETRAWEPGYRLSPEFSPDLKFDRGGMVGMVRVADDVRAPVRANEFFVTTKPQSERFTFVYPIFAEVVDGQSMVNAIRKGEKILDIEIRGDPTPLLAEHADLIEEWNRRLDATPDPRD